MKLSCITQCIAKTLTKITKTFYLPTTRQKVFSAPTPSLWHLRDERIFEIALFVPNSTVIITLLKHLALLVIIDHDATLAVT